MNHTYTNPTNIKFIEDMEDINIPIRDYSGRFMFGKKCPGIVVSPCDAQLIIRNTKVNLRQDDMGLNVILYTGVGE